MKIVMRFSDKELTKIKQGKELYILHGRMPAKKSTEIIPYSRPSITNTILIVSELKGTRASVWETLKQTGYSLCHYAGLTAHKKHVKVYKVLEVKKSLKTYDLTATLPGAFMYVI